MTPPPADLWLRLGNDPVLFYSGCAAALLLAVSLATGWARADFLVLTNPRTGVRMLGAVAFAFLLMVGAEMLSTNGGSSWLPGAARAAARVPLYVVALALGPTPGLAAGALFAGATAAGNLPGAREVLFTFELAVLGWLAIFPSPRTTRFAGPLDALLARALTWGTAGLFYLAYVGEPIGLSALVASSARWPGGVLVSAFILVLLPPAFYRAVFPHSRILHTLPPDGKTATGARGSAPPGRAVSVLDEERGRRDPAPLEPPDLNPDDPTG